MKLKPTKYYLKIIDEIEKVRTKNNVNWMDVLRVALKSDSRATICLLRKINTADKKISKLFEKFKH
ncbi:MAG: hypothetical protein EBZ49_04150 [Proteobacteria bacterium]|nr:hypothetical protein [Pseudomonadota bacterium]